MLSTLRMIVYIRSKCYEYIWGQTADTVSFIRPIFDVSEIVRTFASTAHRSNLQSIFIRLFILLHRFGCCCCWRRYLLSISTLHVDSRV